MSSEEIPSLAHLPIFPLSGAFVFPHLVTPLHIFEPRYLAMVEHALVDDRLIAVVQPDSTRPPHGPDTPAVHEHGGVGRIRKHERLSNGRINIFLAGVGRMRILKEHDTELLYRSVEAEWLDDERNRREEDELAETARGLAISMARHAGPDRAALWAQMASPAINAEVLSNVFPRVVYTEPRPMQEMLELASVPGRLRHLVDDLQMMLLAHVVPGQA